MKHSFIAVLWACALALGTSAHARVVTLPEAVASKGTVILIRHAIAPGFGDPDDFRVDACHTQRNLSREGQAQSQVIGRAFRAAGFKAAPILSSPWCRCLDTARLMNIGPVIPFSGLSSFFQSHASEQETMRALRERLSQIAPTDPPLVMVTHQVVISALTGVGARSGGAVLYDPRQRTSQQIEMPKPPYD